jgi:hypothetical protein
MLSVGAFTVAITATFFTANTPSAIGVTLVSVGIVPLILSMTLEYKMFHKKVKGI